MAKNTYADQAKLILKKYERRLGDDFTKNDVLARKGLELELNELKNKQEAVKAEQATHVMPDGTIMPGATHQEAVDQGLGEFGRGNLPVAQNGLNLNNLSNFNINDPYGVYDLGNAPINLQGDPRFNALRGNINQLEPINAAQVNLEGTQPQAEYYNPALGGTSVLPLAASVAGNLLLRSQADKGIDEVSYDRIRPETIDLSSERVAARSRASQSQNVIRRASRGIASNRADYINRIISGEVATSRLAGEQISRSLTQEQATNAQIANRAAIINANIGIRESEANRAEQNYAQAQKNQAIQNIIGDIGSYFGDVQKAKTYNQLYQQLPGTTSLYADPQQSTIDRILFGQRSTIAQDPTKTQRF